MQRRRSLPLLLVLIAAVFARMAVPLGWMPAGGGSFLLVPCPVAAPVLATAGHHPSAHSGKHGQDHGQGSQDSKPDCPFGAISSVAAISDDLPPTAAAPPLDAPLPLKPRSIPFAQGPPALPPPSTGPPAIT